MWAADWKVFYRPDFGEYFYDAQSITRPSENIVRISVKNVLTQEGVRAWAKRFGSNSETF